MTSLEIGGEGYLSLLTGLGYLVKLLYSPLGREREREREQIHKSSAENKMKSTNTKQQIKVQKNGQTCEAAEIEKSKQGIELKVENMEERG